MFRMWGKIWKDNRMEKDTVYEEESDDTRTHKIFRGLDEICHEFAAGLGRKALCGEGFGK